MTQNRKDTTVALNRPCITVVVCTRNRAAKLAHTLQTLKCLVPPAGYATEIVVVNNGSTDETSQICAAFAARPGTPLRCEDVAIPGTGRAKNAGIMASAGTILAFTDDDIRPEQNWLKIIAREFDADSSLGVISGRVELQNPEDLPLSIRRQKSRKSFQEIGDAFSTFIGCNFAVRRSVFDRVGMFDPEFGPGARFVAAEDADFFYRAWKNGEKLTYVPEMFVLHDHGRRTADSQLKLFKCYLSGRGAFYAKHLCERDLKVARSMYWEMRSMLLSVIKKGRRLNWRYPIWLLKGFFEYTCFRLAHSINHHSGL